MLVIVIYSVVIFAATIIGAIVGMGGGVIIKPVLDMLGYHTVEVVGFISTCAVFSMSISSSVKHIRSKTEIQQKIVLLVSLGSIAGGIIGNEIFDRVFEHFNSDIVKGIQAVIIAALLIFVIFYVNMNLKSYRLTNPAAIVVTGLFLGLMSAFLGIGGGPINTAFLVILFSFTVKESAVYSVAIIFFSQLSQLVTIFINNQFKPYLEYWPIILAACIISVIGGIIGSQLNRKCSDKIITKVFSLTLAFVVIINIFNAIKGFTA